MKPLTLIVQQVGREFNRRPVFRDLSFSLSTPESLAVTGLNGAGKSTLMKILAGVISPTSGRVQYEEEGRVLSTEEVSSHLGFVAPYLNLYEEFSAWENLRLLTRIRTGVNPSADAAEQRLRQVNLWNRREDFVGTFSSGMKQRLKYAFALLQEPAILMLDEPTSNLDSEGIAVVRAVVDEQATRGVLIIATNDDEEAGWCTKRVHLAGSGGTRG